jgi:hypothetical protein
VAFSISEAGEDCKMRKMRWAGNVALMGDMRIAYKILIGKPEGKRTRKT